MRRSRAINLIAFCALVLLADDSSASVSYILKNYVPALLRNPFKQLASLRHGIVPGTLWCGPGHIASNYSELGVNWKLDTCCRAHDFCNDYIRPRSSKYGLYNSAKLCRSSLCECDLQFYDCLKKAPGFVAFNVGRIYFKKCRRCFNAYYDVETCIKRGLVVNEEQGRNGSRVFCAQFDRNPKWKQPHNVAMPRPTAAPPTWIDTEPDQTVPLPYPMDEEDDDTSTDFDIRMLNVS
uniref:phospholipase A2 n=1 Tax=Odontomachus monticola TaxID=613454 RepID=A0A348G5X1_ODOMO